MVCNVLVIRVTHFMTEVLVEVLMTSTLLWDVTPCHQHSGGACYLGAFVVQEKQPYPKNGYTLSLFYVCLEIGRHFVYMLGYAWRDPDVFKNRHFSDQL